VLWLLLEIKKKKMQYINLVKYPIDNLSSPESVALVNSCQEKMKLDGSLLLEGFIKKSVIAQMCSEVSVLKSHRRLEITNVLQRDPFFDKSIYNEKLEKDHPALFQMPQDVHAVASDLIPKRSMLRQVYDSPQVMNFIAAVVGQKKIFQFDDEFQALNVMYIKDGGSRAWHYDGSDYVVTLMLQPSDEGGEFEYAPFIRGDKLGDERLEAVKQLFSGNFPTKKTRCGAGALSIFNGRRSLHRVRTVFGKKIRIMSVLSFAKTQGERGSPEKNVTLYGERVARIYDQRGVKIRTNGNGCAIVPNVKNRSKL
jgi:hypothetical protein